MELPRQNSTQSRKGPKMQGLIFIFFFAPLPLCSFGRETAFALKLVV
jgi:hypothetical protein